MIGIHIVWSWCLLSFLPKLIFPFVLLWLTLTLWQKYYEWQKDGSSPHPLPEGNMGLPVVGNTISLLGNFSSFIDNRQKQYGPVFKLHFFGRPTVAVIGLDHIQKLFFCEPTKVTQEWPTTFQTLLGPGSLAVMTDPNHKIRRKLFLSAFSHSNLTLYAHKMQSKIRSHIENWIEESTIKAYLSVKKITFDIACEILVGFRNQEQEEQDELLQAFHTFIDGMFTLAINIPGFPYYKSLQAKKVLHQKIKEGLEKEQPTQEYKNPTVMSAMLETISSESDNVSLDLLIDGIIEQMFAGYNTTASALSSTMMFLAQNPGVVAKLREEIEEFNVDGDVDLPFDTSIKMPYLNAVMNEVLFHNPPIPCGFRKAKCTLEFGSYQIPKGWSVMYLVRESHHLMADTNFDPNRWLINRVKSDTSTHKGLDEDKKLLGNPISMVAFAAGPRSCIGKEFGKLVIRTFIVEYVKACDAQILSHKVEFNFFPNAVPRDGMPIRLTPRKDRNA